MITLLDRLVQQLDAQERTDGRFHTTCPFCGKPPYSTTGRPAAHFSFCWKGFTCWVCNRRGKLCALAKHLALCPESYADWQPATPPPARPRRPWRDNPGPLIDRFCAALDRVPAWNAYKPLSLESLARYRLGVGRIPLWSERFHQQYFFKHRRLIVPVFDPDGVCVALHGRAYRPDDAGPKWLAAAGSDKRQLFVVGQLARDCMVIVVENYVDAILAHQLNPVAVYIAAGSAAWYAHWTTQLAAIHPQHVLIWLDHDLAGNGSSYHYHELRAAWEAAMRQRRANNPRLAALPMPQAPRPRGPQIAEQLLDAGIATDLYVWPRGTPPKADIGWFLMR